MKRNKLKIVFVAFAMQPCDFIENLAIGLHGKFELIFFAWKNPRPSLKQYGQCYVGKTKDLKRIVLENEINIIHWFQANYHKNFFEYYSFWKRSLALKKIPIVFTHLQYPSNPKLRLSIKAMRIGSFFIFLTRSAISNNYHSIIPLTKKKVIYFGSDPKVIGYSYKNKSKNKLIIGRGSSLGKCPSNMIEVFSKIKCNEPQFVIAGRGGLFKVRQLNAQIKKYNLTNKVTLTGHLAFQEWIDLLKSIDIFAYQLPVNGYSAIDYTIQHAMLTGIPVVLLGPKSPAELIENEKSGFVCKNEVEFIEKVTLLIKDKLLCEEMGLNARKRIINDFSPQQTYYEHCNLYSEVVKRNNITYNYIPFKYRFKYMNGLILASIKTISSKIPEFLLKRTMSIKANH